MVDKYGEGSRRKIQDIYEKNTGEERNGYTGGSQYRGIYESEKVTKERLQDISDQHGTGCISSGSNQLLEKKGKGQRGRIRFDYVGQVYTDGEWVGIEVKVLGRFVK